MMKPLWNQPSKEKLIPEWKLDMEAPLPNFN